MRVRFSPSAPAQRRRPRIVALGPPASVLGALALCALLFSGCATAPAPSEVAAGDQEHCQRLLAEVDDRIHAVGASDAEAVRLEDAPAHRLDRFHARAASRLASGVDPVAWLRGLRALDASARAAEMTNADVPAALRRELDACADRLHAALAADPQRIARLAATAEVPSAYGAGRRLAGLYPLLRPILAAGARRESQRLLQEWQSPPRSPRAPLVRYVPERPAASPLPILPMARLALVPAIRDPRDLWDLVERHAPIIDVETASPADRIGAVRWLSSPLRPGTDPGHPALYVRADPAWFEGRVVLQLSYLAWFPARPPERVLDPLAGRLDGLIWRVTLDADGAVLLHDTIHPCGCWHVAILGERLVARAPPPPGVEVLTVVKAPAGEGRPRIRLASGSHAFVGLEFAPRGAAGPEPHETVSLTLHAWDELRSLALPEGGSRSLHGPDGLVPGTARGERWWLWPSGIRSPGAQRQWGHHATAFTGERHFDDADLLDRWFQRRAPAGTPDGP